MAFPNRKRIYISRHDSNANSTAIPKLLWSNNTIELVRLLTDAGVAGFAIPRSFVCCFVSISSYFAAMFDLRLALTSAIACTSPVVLLGSENMGLAIGISLLSCGQAEIYVTVYVLPVNGGHPSLIYQSLRCRRVLTLVPSCCWIPNMWGWPIEFCW